MQTNSIILCLHGDPRNVNTLCDHYTDEFETKQIATYSIENGLATITELRPVIKTQVNLTLPFTLPVNDLGSGILNRIEINVDTMQPHLAICPTAKWAERRSQQPPLTISQQLIADYCSLI